MTSETSTFPSNDQDSLDMELLDRLISLLDERSIKPTWINGEGYYRLPELLSESADIGDFVRVEV